MRPRSGGASFELEGGSVVNCTGPREDVLGPGSSLLRRLADAGPVAPGPHGLGLSTSLRGALRDRADRPSRVLFTLGPLRKGDLWETIAIPEIRAQAAELAALLVAGHEMGTLASHRSSGPASPFDLTGFAM